MKARVDEDAAKLLDKLRAFRNDYCSQVGARRKRLQTDMNSAASICSAYGAAARQPDAAAPAGDARTEQRKLKRLHAASEKLLRREPDDIGDLNAPSVVFTATSTDDLNDRNLVGQLNKVSVTDSAGQ